MPPNCLSTDMHMAADMHIHLIMLDWSASLTSSRKCNMMSCCRRAYLLVANEHLKAKSHEKVMLLVIKK